MKFTKKLPRWLVVGLAYPLIFLNSWLFILTFEYFKSLLTIIIAAILLAFVLDYPVQFLRRCRVQRNVAIFLVFLLTLFLLLILGLTLAPMAIAQFNELILGLPSWIESSSEQLQAFSDSRIVRKLPINLDGLANQLTERLSGQLQALSGQVLGLVVNTVGSVLTVVLTVVLTFYLLLHGEKLWDGIFEWFPSKYAIQIRGILRQNFHNYFIGQATLAAVMGLSMTVAFLVLKLPFGLLFGLIVGVMTLFPFGAPFSISLVSLLTSLKSFWLGVKVLAIATLIDQVIENGVAPRLLGGFTGLNPVWILVALLVGAKLLGILGLLIAVPLAASIKSIAHDWRTAKRTVIHPRGED
ncbi:MAG TPA: AI-2E family transporter [Cyanobacteria bacterium UBA12227]|nr:AI-2E family transporter [Cyanobacteria bacterium UBA12227]HAX86935.1 AI-2E family transporter [Cyanobacteria bacterium UBA11370]HBY75787.1 AI-2E family transporter [Cyanobacteria bacterium UBA11148]